jgi:hypothetical protein
MEVQALLDQAEKLGGNTWDFSKSGLLLSVLYYLA